MKNVSKTMYIPLYGKALVSRKGIILNDPTAEAIWAQEGFSLRGKAKSKWLAYYMGMRSWVFDRWVQQKMKEHPGAVVLHIGCGLDSRVLRAESTSGCWVDVDFPDVLEERRRYYTESETYRMVAGDARETGWMDSLPKADTAIAVLEGLVMYLTAQELNNLLTALRQRFPNLHLLMDCYTTFGAKASKYKNPINTVGVHQTFGLDDPEVLAEQTGICYVQEHCMTPDDLIMQLKKTEQRIFCKLFAGGFAKRMYRMYEFHAQSETNPETIAKQAAQELATAENLTEANRYLDGLTQQHDGFTKIANNLYRCGDILYNTGLRFAMEAHARGLEAAGQLQIASAPERIAFIRLQNGTHCALITRVEGVSEGMPIPCKGGDWRRISPEGCKSFIADAEKLRESNMINDALLNTASWHVVPSNGMIIVSDWSSLRWCTGAESAHMVEAVKEELADRGLL